MMILRAWVAFMARNFRVGNIPLLNRLIPSRHHSKIDEKVIEKIREAGQ